MNRRLAVVMALVVTGCGVTSLNGSGSSAGLSGAGSGGGTAASPKSDAAGNEAPIDDPNPKSSGPAAGAADACEGQRALFVKCAELLGNDPVCTVVLEQLASCASGPSQPGKPPTKEEPNTPSCKTAPGEAPVPGCEGTGPGGPPSAEPGPEESCDAIIVGYKVCQQRNLGAVCDSILDAYNQCLGASEQK